MKSLGDLLWWEKEFDVLSLYPFGDLLWWETSSFFCKPPKITSFIIDVLGRVCCAPYMSLTSNNQWYASCEIMILLWINLFIQSNQNWIWRRSSVMQFKSIDLSLDCWSLSGEKYFCHVLSFAMLQWMVIISTYLGGMVSWFQILWLSCKQIEWCPLNQIILLKKLLMISFDQENQNWWCLILRLSVCNLGSWFVGGKMLSTSACLDWVNQFGDLIFVLSCYLKSESF